MSYGGVSTFSPYTKIAVWPYHEVLNGWGNVLAINQDVVLLSDPLVFLCTPFPYELWWTPSRALSQCVRGNA